LIEAFLLSAGSVHYAVADHSAPAGHIFAADRYAAADRFVAVDHFAAADHSVPEVQVLRPAIPFAGSDHLWFAQRPKNLKPKTTLS